MQFSKTKSLYEKEIQKYDANSNSNATEECKATKIKTIANCNFNKCGIFITASLIRSFIRSAAGKCVLCENK